MSEPTTRERIRKLMEEHFGPATTQGLADSDKPWKEAAERAAARRAAGESNAGVTGELDSLDKVEFIMALEEEFDVEIPDSWAAMMESIDDMASFIDTTLASKNADNH